MGKIKASAPEYQSTELSSKDLSAIEYPLIPLANAIKEFASTQRGTSVTFEMNGPSSGMYYANMSFQFPDRFLSLVYRDESEGEGCFMYEIMTSDCMGWIGTKPITLSQLIFPDKLAEELVKICLCEDDSCPSCGCLPGEGITQGCVDPNGCGAERQTSLNLPTQTVTEYLKEKGITDQEAIDFLNTRVFELAKNR